MNVQPTNAALSAASHATQPAARAASASVAAEAVKILGASPAGKPEAAQPTPEQLAKALDDVRSVVEPVAQSLRFSMEQDSGRTIVKVMDVETNEVIRQIPSEEVLAISKAIDKLQGLLVEHRA